jgi:septum formation protein
VVVVDDQIMGKPQDATEAVAMLNILQGRSHQVLTGLALLYQGRGKVDVGITTVWMDPMPPEAIEAYVATGEPLDKAGAYAIQGGAAMWIPRIQGCYFNVVGLPISQLARMIKQATK